MRNFIIQTIANLTSRDRYIPNVKWEKNNWTHNVFRAWELLFGRAYGPNGVGDTIRCESSLGMYEHSDGTVSIRRDFYTTEALIAHTESVIRQQLANIGAFLGGAPAPYPLMPSYALASVALTIFGLELHLTGNSIFAPIVAGPIAYDNSGKRDTGTGNPNTVSYTTSGSDRYMVLFATNQNASDIGTNTYAGVNFNAVQDVFYNSIPGMKCYGRDLVNPASGANTVSVAWGGGTGIRFCVASYTGCKQSGQPDASNKTQQSGATSVSVVVNVVASNCWLVSGIQAYNSIFNSPGTNGNVTNSAGTTTQRQTIDDQTCLFDSNGTVSTGNNTVTYNMHVSSNLQTCMAWSIAPAVAPATGGFFRAAM